VLPGGLIQSTFSEFQDYQGLKKAEFSEQQSAEIGPWYLTNSKTGQKKKQ